MTPYEERDALLAEASRWQLRAEQAEAERDKWRGYFDSLSRSVKADALSERRTCKELATKYQLKPPPDGRGGRWSTDHDWHTIMYRMGQRLVEAQAQIERLRHYADHRPECGWRDYNMSQPCSCGFDDSPHAIAARNSTPEFEPDRDDFGGNEE